VAAGGDMDEGSSFSAKCSFGDGSLVYASTSRNIAYLYGLEHMKRTKSSGHRGEVVVTAEVLSLIKEETRLREMASVGKGVRWVYLLVNYVILPRVLRAFRFLIVYVIQFM
jgi:hypothetical protein